MAARVQPQPLPDVNVPCLVTLIIDRYVKWLPPPTSGAFPDLDRLSKDERSSRWRYFVSAIFFTFVLYSLAGTLLLAIRKAILAWRRGDGHEATYAPLGWGEKDNVQQFVRQSWTASLAVATHMVFITAMLLYSMRRGAVSVELGVAWEFWYLWLLFSLSAGIIETMLLFCRPGDWPMNLYTMKMLLVHMPFLSEKVDTCKDLLFSVVAIHSDRPLIGGLNVGILAAAQLYFLIDMQVRGELLESYLPILSSAPTEQISGAPSRCAGIKAMARKGEDLILKQFTPARMLISLVEDLPQAMLTIWFMLSLHKRSPFIFVSLILTLFRLCSQTLAPWVRKQLIDMLQDQLRDAELSGNKSKLRSVVKQLWEAGDKDVLHHLRGESKAEDLAEIALDTREQGELRLAAATELKAVDETRCLHILHGKQGFEAQKLRSAGFNADDLKRADFDASELMTAGFEVDELRRAGFAIDDLKNAGCELEELKNGGFTAGALIRRAGFELKDLRKAGVDAYEMKMAGVPAYELKRLGFSSQELKRAGFAGYELKMAGFNQLRKIGFTVEELRSQGFGIDQLREAGFDAYHLKRGGFELKELHEAGFSVAALSRAGFKPDELRKAGLEPVSWLS